MHTQHETSKSNQETGTSVMKKLTNYTVAQLKNVQFHTSVKNPLIFLDHESSKTHLKIQAMNQLGTSRVGVWHIDDINASLSGHKYSQWELLGPINGDVYPNGPLKHAELIKAWADGAEIEIFMYGEWCKNPLKAPTWRDPVEYRIKPNQSDKDVQIEALEKQARQLADDISKLKGS